jgi:hypothetical protein
MKNIVILIIIFSIPEIVFSQYLFNFKKTPAESGLKMEGYWVWGGSVIKVGSTYHLFASRWEKKGAFPEGYRQDSEIVRATSKSPLGPFKFQEIIIGERDSSYWDSNMAHNPTIHKIGNEYVLFYIGSDFTTVNKDNGNLLRRIGYASSKSVTGPWIRSDNPVIKAESNNPAILDDGKKIRLLYRDNGLKVLLAESDNYKGPYKVINENVYPESRLEDFYMFKAGKGYHIVCEDNMGIVSGHVRWGIHLFSDNGVNEWKKDDPVVVYDHDIVFDNDSVLHCVRRERPQLLIRKNKITHLYTGVYDGKDSWCQPVGLIKPFKLK